MITSNVFQEAYKKAQKITQFSKTLLDEIADKRFHQIPAQFCHQKHLKCNRFVTLGFSPSI